MEREDKEKALSIGLGVCLVALIITVIMWQSESNKPPEKIIETVTDTLRTTVHDTVVVRDTVETVRKVIVVKRDTIQAPKTELEEIYNRFFWNYFKSEIVSSEQAISDIDTVDVLMNTNDAIEELLTKKRLKTKAELMLRQYRIPIKSSYDDDIFISMEGLWDDKHKMITYIVKAQIRRKMHFLRDLKFYYTYAPVWEELSYGYAGNLVAKEAIIDAFNEKVESAVNALLSSR